MSRARSGKSRDHRRRDRDTGARPVLRNSSLRYVYMQVLLLKIIRIYSETLRTRSYAGQRCFRRFLHHLAQLPCQRYLAFSFDERRFNLQNIAANLGPCEAVNETYFTLASDVLLSEPDRPEKL